MPLLLASLFLLFAQSTAPARPTGIYYLVFLRPDPARKPISKEEGERIQAAHMANIMASAERGVLVAAGPFDDKPTTISGIFVFRAPSLAEARRMAMEDPTVVEHRNLVDVHAWQGPAGIGDEYFRLHKEKPDTPEGMGVQPLFLVRRGPARAERDRVWAAHLEYVEKLRLGGKVAMAGATVDDDALAGMVVFERMPDDEAQRLMAEDPAVKAKVLETEFHRWWCAEHVFPR